MKAKKAMKKTMKKAMKVSKIAKGKHARAVVFRGGKEKTKTGMTKGDLIKNKNGHIVAKKASAAAKKRFQGSKIQAWAKACQKARKELNIKGFCPFGGKTALARPCMPKPRPSTTLEVCL